jgi:hypothetical protein
MVKRDVGLPPYQQPKHLVFTLKKNPAVQSKAKGFFLHIFTLSLSTLTTLTQLSGIPEFDVTTLVQLVPSNLPNPKSFVPIHIVPSELIKTTFIMLSGSLEFEGVKFVHVLPSNFDKPAVVPVQRFPDKSKSMEFTVLPGKFEFELL